MLIHLHSQATTTPKVRAAIQASDEVGTVLAERFGVTPQTIYKWRKRDSVEDRSHTPHRLQTTLTPAQEAVAVALRRALLVSLDDLLAVVREFLNPHVSRSGLDRCLRRHGVGNLRDLQAKTARPKRSGFKAYEPGYIHIDVKYLPQMADETSRRYLFVAIDRATRWVFIRVFKAKTAANARRFLRDLERACPIRIRTILTDNGKEFTDRLFGLRKRAATGEHEFDKLCTELAIEHRLTPPKSPQTNGMVERFNGRIEEVLQSHHFRSGEELETTLHRYVWLYNQQLPQSALGSKSPLQAMKEWHKLKPQLFRKQPYYLPGSDTYTHFCNHSVAAFNSNISLYVSPNHFTCFAHTQPTVRQKQHKVVHLLSLQFMPSVQPLVSKHTHAVPITAQIACKRVVFFCFKASTSCWLIVFRRRSHFENLLHTPTFKRIVKYLIKCALLHQQRFGCWCFFRIVGAACLRTTSFWIVLLQAHTFVACPIRYAPIPICSSSRRRNLIKQHTRAIFVLKVWFEITRSVFLVPILSACSPSAILLISLKPIVPMLFKCVIV